MGARDQCPQQPHPQSPHFPRASRLGAPASGLAAVTGRTAISAAVAGAEPDSPRGPSASARPLRHHPSGRAATHLAAAYFCLSSPRACLEAQLAPSCRASPARAWPTSPSNGGRCLPSAPGEARRSERCHRLPVPGHERAPCRVAPGHARDATSAGPDPTALGTGPADLGAGAGAPAESRSRRSRSGQSPGATPRPYRRLGGPAGRWRASS